MPSLLAYSMLFTGVAVFFIFIHLMIGRLVRPNRPTAEKKTIYECGEPTIGTAWIQFDLRFYVVALLFVVFDVEMAFFFPWAVVFGKANQLSDASLSAAERQAIQDGLSPGASARREHLDDFARRVLERKKAELADLEAKNDPQMAKVIADLKKEIARSEAPSDNVGPSRTYAFVAFVDILIFFVVLVVGFAYLWKRGDLDWVRSTAAQH
jgi:NADH-quinone oxidoreductase subunit A